MRKISWVLLSVGLLMSAFVDQLSAQDKYKDLKAEQEAQRKAREAIQNRLETGDDQLEHARKLFEKAFQEQLKRELGEKEKPKIVIQKKIVDVEKKGPAESLESKIERLLKEMSELRKDVNEIKSKLKFPTPANNYWQQYGPYLQTKPAESKKEEEIEIEKIRKKQAELIEAAKERVEIERRRAEELRKAVERQEEARKAVERAELEQRLDQLLRQADELRRAIEKSKAK
jgi:hypothetical protein